MYLSIIVPAYNEEKRISQTLSSLHNYLSNQAYDYEVLIIDDGSKDLTSKTVEDFSKKINSNFKLIQQPENLGKGAAVREGVSIAKGEFILFSDADLSSPIKEFERLLIYLEQGYEVVVGSRNIRSKEVKVDALLKRKMIGRIFNLFVQILVLPAFKDTQCGFKAFKKRAAKKIFSEQKLNGFSFDVEILYITVKMGFRYKEVAVNWKHFDNGKVDLFKDSYRMFRDILKIKKMHKNKKNVNEEVAV